MIPVKWRSKSVGELVTSRGGVTCQQVTCLETPGAQRPVCVEPLLCSLRARERRKLFLTQPRVAQDPEKDARFSECGLLLTDLSIENNWKIA